MTYLFRPLTYSLVAASFFAAAYAQESQAYRVYVTNEYGGIDSWKR